MDFWGFLRDVGVSALGGGIGIALLAYLSRSLIEQRLQRSLAEHQAALDTDAHKNKVRWEKLHERQLTVAEESANRMEEIVTARAQSSNQQTRRVRGRHESVAENS